MNRDDVKARVYKVIAQVLKIEESQIDESNSFTADLGTNEQLRPILLGKPGCIAVPFNQG